MRDIISHHPTSAQQQSLFANARKYLPDNVAALHVPAPSILGWRDNERMLYWETVGTTLRLMQWQKGGVQELLSCEAWAMGAPEMTLRDLAQVEGMIAANGDVVYLHIMASGYKIDLNAVPCKLEKVSAMPQRLPQSGLPLLMLQAEQGLLCPNGQYVLHVVQDNLLLQDLTTGTQRFLTLDGGPEFSYGIPLYFGLQVQKDGSVNRPIIASWSPCGRYLLSYKLDYRTCHRRQMLRCHSDGSEQVLSWPEVMTGQTENVPMAQLCLFDVQTQRALPLQGPEFPFFDADYASQFFLKQIYWHKQSLYFLPWGRGRRQVDLFRTDLLSGRTEHIYTERSNSNIEYSFFPEQCWPTDKQVFWLSEQDGWSHIYQLQEYGPPRQLTVGNWAVRAIVGGDAQGKYVYFLAGGREVGIDPYFRQLYRLNLHTLTIERLTPENADHEVALAPDGSKFIDSYSRADLPIQVVVRQADGNELAQIGKADFSNLYATGWRAPQAFSVKARDAETDLHGLILFPPNMREHEQYPVVVSIYPGCHTVTVPKRLSIFGNHIHFMQSLAALGFIVLRLDSMGGPGRSKAFHDLLYRNLGDAGLPDQVGALPQLASQYPQMDLQRVGLLGSSAGGYATARGMLCYPHIFKTGVAAAGCHDLLHEGAEWTEDYAGWPIDQESLYFNSNSRLAEQLQGRLLLLHGALDDNVSVTQSQRLGAALIKANKPVEMMIVADADHACILRADVQEHVWRFLLNNL